MTLKHFVFSSLGFNSKNRKAKNKRAKFEYQTLEPRQLLAGIVLNAAGDLVVFGDNGNDTGRVVESSTTTLRAELTGVTSQTFDRADVSRVIFIGNGGNDTFTNATSIDSNLLGNAGNDTLIGGSGVDVINGGVGNDILTGNEGVDRLVGFDGDDIIRAGNGDDIIIGGDGANQLFGDDGNDLIFGGANVDRMFGGEGIDVLVGFEGDDIMDVGNGGIVSPGTDNADLALGFEGNDQITGGNGLNVLYGGDGNDIINGGTGVTRFHGQNGNDTLNGGSADDFIAGQNGDDEINGRGGNDFILPGQGDDTVDGGAGVDRGVFPRSPSDYRVFEEGSVVGVSGNGQGFDRLTGFENLLFNGTSTEASDDTTIPARTAATRFTTIRPIIVSNNNGSNQATHFGNAAQQFETRLLVDQTFATAGVDIRWEAPRFWNNTAANSSGAGDPVAQIAAIVENGDDANVGSPNARVVDMYFVSRAPGSSGPNDLSVTGFALIGDNGVTMQVGETLTTTFDGRQLVSRIVAHELSHNFGLDHVASTTNLMNPAPAGDNLTTVQISAIESSRFTLDI